MTYQLATFRKPFTEQRMGINLDQLALCISDLDTTSVMQMKTINIRTRGETGIVGLNLELKRIESFCANALHKDVLPVPGGP